MRLQFETTLHQHKDKQYEYRGAKQTTSSAGQSLAQSRHSIPASKKQLLLLLLCILVRTPLAIAPRCYVRTYSCQST